MANPILSKCPVCGDTLEITCLHCKRCKTKIEGQFELDRFSYLTQEQKHFIGIFLKCRGNIREVEKELNISYPTVRSKLEDVVVSLGYEISAPDRPQVDKKEILEKLEKGEISYDEAIKAMRP